MSAMAPSGPLHDPQRRFDPVADDYDRHRPTYPAALVDWILAMSGLRPPAVVADVGCGTGIATRLFAERGLEAVGVEPSPEMRARARARGGARYVPGLASDTGLPDRSVDLVTVAQAFHWFEPGPALAEFRRILRGDRWCAVFWNLRDGTPFMRAYDALLREWSPPYREQAGPEDALARLRTHPAVLDPVGAELTLPGELDLEGLVGNARSLSYVAHGVADRQGFERALARLFEDHAKNGRVPAGYRTVALGFRLA